MYVCDNINVSKPAYMYWAFLFN